MTDQQDPQTYAILGCAMEVHRVLGPGFLEGVYHEALCLELGWKQIPFARKARVPVRYKEQVLSCSYEADLICFGEVIVELKALAELNSVHEAQVLNYLKATGFHRALLLNFGAQRLGFKRYVLTKHEELPADNADLRR